MATLPQWIEARVIQKIATEAEWNAITLVPYKGEVCLAGDSGGKVVNIKIGDGINTFPNLEYMFDSIQQNVGYIAIESNALPTPFLPYLPNYYRQVDSLERQPTINL